MPFDAKEKADCRALYLSAFPLEEADFTDRLFALFSDCLRVKRVEGRVVSMLFSIPYDVRTESGTLPARYLYGVATAPDCRGRGFARALIAAEAGKNAVFLCPSDPSLFAFYRKCDLTPFSPVVAFSGAACPRAGAPACRALSPAEYLAAREEKLLFPHCVPSAAFLSLALPDGGFAAVGDAIFMYGREENEIFFSEWWGERTLLPHAAALLGGSRFSFRAPDARGVPLGMMRGLPPDTVFTAAMD